MFPASGTIHRLRVFTAATCHLCSCYRHYVDMAPDSVMNSESHMSDVLFIKKSSVFNKEKLITCHDLKNSEKVTLSGHFFPKKKNLFKAQFSSPFKT